MPQYLNPYEGVGNALINIGQNYDLDRRRKREAEEDQKRRRADYLWQSKKDEEAEARRYERMAPEREAKQKLDMLRAASQAAKAQRDLIESQMSKFINLPGASGAIERKPQFDAEGNLVGYEDKKIPFTPYPTKPEGPSWISGVDENGNLVNFDRTTGRTVKTDLRPISGGLLNQGLSERDRMKLAGDESRAMAAVDSMTPEQLGVSSRDAFDPAAIEGAKRRKREAIATEFRLRRGDPEPAAPSSPSALGVVGAIGKGASSLMGGIAKAVTPMTEQSVADAFSRGEIDQQEFADRMSKVIGTPVSATLANPSTGETKTATAGAKKEEPAKPSYEEAYAQVEAAFPDWPKRKIDAYLREKKGITPNKEKK